MCIVFCSRCQKSIAHSVQKILLDTCPQGSFSHLRLLSGRRDRSRKQKKMSFQLLFNSWMTFVSIRLLEDIYIVKEIAGKCQKELAGFDRALRNVAFLYSLAFWGLKVKWISLICLHAGCSLAAPLAIVTLIVASAKWAFCDSRRGRVGGCLLHNSSNGAAFILRGALPVKLEHLSITEHLQASNELNHFDHLRTNDKIHSIPSVLSEALKL